MTTLKWVSRKILVPMGRCRAAAMGASDMQQLMEMYFEYKGTRNLQDLLEVLYDEQNWKTRPKVVHLEQFMKLATIFLERHVLIAFHVLRHLKAVYLRNTYKRDFMVPIRTRPLWVLAEVWYSWRPRQAIRQTLGKWLALKGNEGGCYECVPWGAKSSVLLQPLSKWFLSSKEC
eukprot:5783255-Amphidinium_carterae.1